MKDEKLRSYFQKRLSDYRHPVDDALWLRLENRTVSKKKRRRLILSAVGCCAVVVVLFFLILFPVKDTTSDPVRLTEQLLNGVVPPEEEYPINPEISADGDKTKKEKANGLAEEKEKYAVPPDDNQALTDIPRQDSLPMEKTSAGKQESPSVRPARRQPVLHTGTERRHRGKLGLQLAYQGGINSKPFNRSESDYFTSGSTINGANGKPVEITDPVYDFPISISMTVSKSWNRNFSIETGLTYSYLRTTVRNGDTDIRLHYLGIPVKATYTFYKNNRFSLYAGGGGTVERQIAGKVMNGSGSTRLVHSGLQWSVSGTAGIGYTLARHTGIYMEPGVSYFFDDGSRIPTLRKDKPLQLYLQVGFRIQLE